MSTDKSKFNFTYTSPYTGTSYGTSGASGIGKLLSAAGMEAAPATGGLTAIIPLVYGLLSGLGVFGSDVDDQSAILDKQAAIQKALLELQRKWALEDQKKKAQTANYAAGQLKPALPFYQSPFTGAMDKTAMQAIMNQLNRTNDMGYPAGMAGGIPMLQTLLGGGAGNIEDLAAKAAAATAAAERAKAIARAHYQTSIA
jgi:hypothetical protein